MKMISERGINIHMFPMIQRRGRVFKEDYVRKDSKGQTMFVATEDSRWNLRCYKFMDWLSTKIRKRFDECIIAENPELGIAKTCNDERISKKCNLLFKPSNFLDILNCLKGNQSSYNLLAQPYTWNPTITFKQISKELGWEKQHVIEVIKIITECKMKFAYSIKTGSLYNNSYKFNFKSFHYVPENFESFFNIEINEDNCTFLFNTGFSLCFIHNIMTGGYELIDDKLYNLSESSQIVYRQRFFTYTKMLTTLTKTYVFNLLGISGKNITTNNKLFQKIITELIDMKMVDMKEKVELDHYVLRKHIPEKRKIIEFPVEKVRSN